MSRTLLAALALAALAGCGRSDREEVGAADSLSRDLELAPVDTTAELNDQPEAEPDREVAATPESPPARTQRPAAPAPRPTTPAKPAPEAAPAPAPAAAALAAGTSFTASTDTQVHSGENKVGDEITATVQSDVKDASGRTVIPAGSQVTLQVTAIGESENKSDTTGTLTLKPVSVVIGGGSQPLAASISGVKTELRGRGTGAGDIAKVGAGAAAGAVVGRVLGGSTKGAIIGGIIGGAVGTQRAVETKDRDVVLPQGTAVTLTLDERFVAQGG